MHLSDVEYNQYADDQEQDDWYDEGVAEGWSDAMVSRRTGTPRTPYSVYIKGKKWKDFENDDHAEAVANKLRAKFRAEGRDPSVITIAPTDIPEGVAEATGDSKFDAMMGKISKDPWTQLNSDPNWEYEIEELVDQYIEPWLLAMEKSGMPITRDNKTLNPGWRKRYEQVSTQLAQKYLALKKFNPRDPDLVGKIRAAIDNHTDQSRNVHGQLSAYANDLPLNRYADAFDADGMTANIRDAMAGLTPRDDDDDDGYAPRPRPEANPRRLDPGNMEEGVTETALNPRDPKGDYAAKRRALHDLSLNKDVDQAAVQQRRLDLDREAKNKGVAEAQTDYQKRRQRERDIDAGRPVKALPKNPQTDYARKRAQDKRNMELGEDQDTSGVERAILNRIMVAHTDLLMKFGPEKVMQAAEEVAYNVGDVDEIGTSDVSAYVHQVKQILGVPEELDEKWSQKYKSSINCASPKGFSQKAHCAGKKK
jgi:hypothetical protein